jgi:hypothetical protein
VQPEIHNRNTDICILRQSREAEEVEVAAEIRKIKKQETRYRRNS